jgi:MFS family permease
VVTLPTVDGRQANQCFEVPTLGEMIIYPAEFLFVDTLAPEELRGSYYGAQNLATFGGALSPVICGFLLMHTPAPTMLYALSALTALGGLCFMSGRRMARVLK